LERGLTPSHRPARSAKPTPTRRQQPAHNERLLFFLSFLIETIDCFVSPPQARSDRLPPPLPAMDGGDDLAALHEQVALAFSAAISASDLDLAFQLQVAEAIQASLGLPNAAAPSSSSQAAPESSSDATYAFAVQAADLARAEEDRRDAEACRAANARAAANARVVAHDALFARDLAAIPEEQWDHDGDYFERPVESSPCPPFRVFSKGMASREVVAPRDRDPSVAVLAVAICGPQGEEVLRIQKLVERFVGGRMMVELMALMEGLDAALGLGIRSVTMVTGYGPLYKHV
jgi:hypothetical protein